MTRFLYRCPLRWSDMDSYGHVNNVQFLRLLEEARVALFFEEPKRSGIDTLAETLVVVRHEIDYRAALVYRPAPVPIHLWVTRVGGASFTVRYQVADDGVVYADAASVIAAYDPATRAARRLSARERAWLDTYLDPAG